MALSASAALRVIFTMSFTFFVVLATVQYSSFRRCRTDAFTAIT